MLASALKRMDDSRLVRIFVRAIESGLSSVMMIVESLHVVVVVE